MKLTEKIKNNEKIQQNDISELGKNISLEDIINVVCKVINVNKIAIYSRSRKRELVEARQLYFYFARIIGGYGLAKIGELTGRDHTSVIYGAKVIADLKTTDKRIGRFVDRITEILK